MNASTGAPNTKGGARNLIGEPDTTGLPAGDDPGNQSA